MRGVPVALLVSACLAPLGRCESVRHEVIMEGTRYETGEVIKTGAEPGPTVMVIGGCHGNEIAGYKAAGRLVDWTITKGTLAVIPKAHQEAIRRNERGYPGNMNAMFPGDPNGDDMQQLANAIWRKIKELRPGLLVTLHESLGFHHDDPDSYGQTLTHDFTIINPLMQRAIDRTNADIGPAREQFRIFIYPVATCPTYTAWKHLRIPATSIETAMPLDLQQRVRYQLMMLMGFFDEVGLGYQQGDVDRLSTASRPPGTDLSTYVADITGQKPPPKPKPKPKPPRAEPVAKAPEAKRPAQSAAARPVAAAPPTPMAAAPAPAPRSGRWIGLVAGGAGGTLVGLSFVWWYGRELRRQAARRQARLARRPSPPCGSGGPPP